MSLTIKSLAAAAALLLAAPAAFATPTVKAWDATTLSAPPSGFGNLADFSSVTGKADSNGMLYDGNLSFAGQGGGTISFQNGSSPYAGVYAAGTDNNNVLDPTYNTGLSHANFLASEVGNDIVMNFNKAQSSFSLLWGSVDTYNSVIFKFSGGGSTYTLTGAQVAQFAGKGFNANGSTSAFVKITGLDSFKTLTIEDSTRPAFELVTEDLGKISVPEPASLAMLMSGLVVFGLYVSRRPNRSV